MMHPIYLPFTKQQFLSHFADVKRNGVCIKNRRHLKYYKNSIKRYNEYLANNSDRKEKPLNEMRFPCQIEKDERFWTATCMMTTLYSSHRLQEFIHLFNNTYGDVPPVTGINFRE